MAVSLSEGCTEAGAAIEHIIEGHHLRGLRNGAQQLAVSSNVAGDRSRFDSHSGDQSHGQHIGDSGQPPTPQNIGVVKRGLGTKAQGQPSPTLTTCVGSTETAVLALCYSF